MHLLVAAPGRVDEGEGAVDLGQTPGDVLILSSADSELACLAGAYRCLESPPFSLRLANLLRLSHPLSVDLYLERMIGAAKLVVVRLLGGRAYWSYGVEQLENLCRRHAIPLVLLPGDDRPDADLAQASTAPAEESERLWRCLTFGGVDNAARALAVAGRLAGFAMADSDDNPAPLPPAGPYPAPATSDSTRPTMAVVFYRALALAGDTAPIDALLAALTERGCNAYGLFVHSLKDPLSAAAIERAFAAAPPDVILNATGFAVAGFDRPEAAPFTAADCPVLQVILAGGGEDSWRAGTRGLSPRDIAMAVALPEVDGRLITRAISFKAATRDEATQCDIARHAPVADRVAFVADLAVNWAGLRRKPAPERRIAMVLANYPNRDGRLANGVGLDTPAACVNALEAMAAAGYDVAGAPKDGNDLIRLLQEGPTNDWRNLGGRLVRESLPLSEYQMFLASLPQAAQDAVRERWGRPEFDPFYRPGEVDCGSFLIPALRFGRVVVAIQPARGYNIDPNEAAHDPALVPPHNYLAFHAWLRHAFRADAIIHMGKHGNLEWLPGQALALSADCYPELCLGPLPHLYPFIVNDPGEGTQAKRRAGAVIIDHLTPPLTRAGTYGPLRDLERVVDEYYEAAGLDPRRLPILRREIWTLAAAAGLNADLGLAAGDESDAALTKLDTHLCDLKELQIRDGLHIFGRSPTGRQRTDLLAALARLPRGPGEADASLPRALAADLGLEFDPLDGAAAEPWTGPRPDILVKLSPEPWRSRGDTVERLEVLAAALIDGAIAADPAWTRAAPVLAEIATRLGPAIDGCGAAELAGLLAGLDGRFVAPGPSGAPTRGRPDVLPTGRNFFSVDTRAVPTQAAWALGWKSATLLLERHLQDHGVWPRAVALSAWGTSAMRTGGDDIAQGLALMGVRPTWDHGSGRVSGFEILPASLLDRPRIDVTLRVSGFFRDAFPSLIDLFDSAARAVAALDEPADINPLADQVRADSPTMGEKRAAARVFGSKPGAYGAGPQALIDEGGWATGDDLGQAYLAWGGWAYGGGAEGEAAHDSFRTRLAGIEAIIHNQDNREHDLLDSDDYYQFEGGLAAAVHMASGTKPQVWHTDHSRPESPRIRSLEEEIARVVRARVVNPKWIEGIMRHGYKGAFEMAATVDYLFAFAATAGAVKDHQFDLVAQAYLGDEAVRDFLAENNPKALAEIRARLKEAIDRGLWQPRSNSVGGLL